jgi:hypothetical protein
MKYSYLITLILFIALFFASCSKESSHKVAESEPSVIIKFKFEENQARLNNLGKIVAVPQGNAAQTPVFNKIAAHYLELTPNANTQIGKGAVVYHAPETAIGGSNAIDFSKSRIVAEGENFLKIPISKIEKGSYQWVRVSLSYQNYDIKIRQNGADFNGTLASFVGFNNYIGTFSVGNSTFPVNGNRPQGYWGLNVQGMPFSGQAPVGATTVPNPIAATSPIPAGSCVVTGKFAENLVVKGNETKDVVVTLSLSINKSFEWHEVNVDQKYEPAAGEKVVDMGLRGLVPSYRIQ